MKLSIERLAIFLSTLAAIAVSGLSTRAAETTVLYRHQWIGSSEVMAGKEGLRFQEIWKLPQMEAVRHQVADSLVQASLRKVLSPGAPADMNLSISTTQLLNDLIDSESWIDVRGPTSSLEWVVAVRLPADRQKSWMESLPKIAAGLGFAPAEPAAWDGSSGWKATRMNQSMSWVQKGDWTVVGGAAQMPSLWAGVLAEWKTTARPVSALTNGWLELSSDLTRLRQFFPLIPEFVGSQLKLTFGGKGENVRTQGTLKFSTPLDWNPEPWQVPTDTIRDPLVGFSAARGIRTLLGKGNEARALGVTSLPDQAFGWSMARIPEFLFLTYPQTGVSNLMWNTLPQVPALLTNYGRLVGEMSWVSNSTRILWRGLPFVQPHVQPLTDAGREFLVAGLLPLPRSPHQAPAELFAFTNRSNLAFYDWEITDARVSAWRKILLIGLLSFGRESPDTNAPTQQLLDQLSMKKRLGNSVSEVTVTGPDELSFLRHSHLGLTGLEIVNVLRWFDSSNFPFTYEPAPMLDMKKAAAERRSQRPAQPTTPASPAIPGKLSSPRPGLTPNPLFKKSTNNASPVKGPPESPVKP